jgi:L-aspartate semialdehyde sulfurtransferase ferredoxin
MKNIYYLQFDEVNTNQPVISSLVKSHNVDVNILRAGIDARKGGFMVIELYGEKGTVEQSVSFLKQKKVHVDEISSRIHHRSERCVSCGACTAVCFVGALVLDNQKELHFDPKKCIACSLCTKACPFQLFTLNF